MEFISFLNSFNNLEFKFEGFSLMAVIGYRYLAGI